MVAGGAEGAAYGAAAGAGGSEGGLSERLKAAGQNMPLGAVMGAGSIPIADYLVKPAAGVISNIYNGMRNPDKQGRDMLVQSIMRDRSTPEAMAQRVEQAAAAGQPDYVALDAGGRNTLKLGKMAARTPGEFRNEVGPQLDARQGGQADRIAGFIDEATGATGPNARQIERGITAGRAAACRPAVRRRLRAPAAGRCILRSRWHSGPQYKHAIGDAGADRCRAPDADFRRFGRRFPIRTRARSRARCRHQC
jgi:hypothetical protein